MTLHEDAEGFLAAIDATAEHLGIRNIHVEKDYWLTRALKNLAASEMAPCVVFKGGTSLSKAFRLIERFSEDVVAASPEQAPSVQRYGFVLEPHSRCLPCRFS